MGRRYARKGLQVTLVDEDPTHIWKPLLHEVATGSLDPGIDELSYRAQARSARFKFQIGRLESIDRAAKTLNLAAVTGIDGEAVLPVLNLNAYGLTKLNRSQLEVTLIEAGPRILSALPEYFCHWRLCCVFDA